MTHEILLWVSASLDSFEYLNRVVKLHSFGMSLSCFSQGLEPFFSWVNLLFHCVFVLKKCYFCSWCVFVLQIYNLFLYKQHFLVKLLTIFYCMTGQHLQNLMKQEGYSVNKMAEMIGRSQQNLATLLKHDDVRTSLVEDIAKAMGKPLSFFYGESFGPVSQILGNNNTSVAGNDNTVGSPDEKLLSLLVSKDEQLTMAMKQTSKAQEQMDRVLDKFLD